MQVAKEMYDAELQGSYRSSQIVRSIVSKNWGVKMLNLFSRPMKGRKLKGFHNEEHYIPSSYTKGHKIRVRVFRPANSTGPLPAMLYNFGGGYLTGFPEQPFPFYEAILNTREVAIVAPEYRLSQKHPYPAGFNDCYDTLLWMKQNAAQLNIRSDKFMVAGHSAGGGMTAALTLKARDTQDVNVAFQMPIYPMLDHRQESASAQLTKAPFWDSVSNAFAWNHYLKGLAGKPVPIYASPALSKDLSGLPPTISLVGELEPFRDEDVAYIEGLKAAGVPVKFKLFEKAFHGFDVVAPKTKIGREAIQFQVNAFAEYFDTYMAPVPGA